MVVSKRTLLSAVGPAAAGLLVSAVSWASVPDPMPIHWDASGDPNGWAPRAVGLLFTPVVGLLAAGITGWAMRRATKSDAVSSATVLGIGGFHLGLHGLIVHAALHPTEAFSITGILMLMGALIGGLGLAMPHLKQNRWAGVRTPWTLADEVNWTLTHRFAGWSMGIAGALSMVAAALLAPPASFWAAISVILVGSLLPLVYSYVIHRMRRSR